MDQKPVAKSRRFNSKSVPNVAELKSRISATRNAAFVVMEKNLETDADPRKKGKLDHKVLKHTAKLFLNLEADSFAFAYSR